MCTELCSSLYYQCNRCVDGFGIGAVLGIARVLSNPFSHPDWLFETKWDGFRTLFHSDEAGVRLVSGNGNVIKSFADLCAGLTRDLKGRRCSMSSTARREAGMATGLHPQCYACRKFLSVMTDTRRLDIPQLLFGHAEIVT